MSVSGARGSREFGAAPPKIWNDMPYSGYKLATHSLFSFMQNLKTFLICTHDSPIIKFYSDYPVIDWYLSVIKCRRIVSGAHQFYNKLT